jgi:hypothetical protein
MNNNTVFHYNSYTRIHFKCDFNGINAYSESWVNSVFLSYAYFFIYLWLITTVVYCIIVSSGSVNIPYWEILLQKIIAAIGVPFVMTCFFCELAWILFHKQELTISSFEINYKLTVIFPIIRHKIPINTVTNISIIQDKYGFGIVFSTKINQ